MAVLRATQVAVHRAGLPEGSYQFGLRATDLSLARTGIEGEGTFVEISGSETFVHVAVNEAPFVVQSEGIHDVDLGELVAMKLRPERLFAFDKNGTLVRPPTNGHAAREGH